MSGNTSSELFARDKNVRVHKSSSRDGLAVHARRTVNRKRLILILASIVVIAGALVVTDILVRTTRPLISIDFLNQEQSLAEWWRVGFVRSMNDSTGAMIVNEEIWMKLSKDQRMGVASLLRWHYSNRSTRGFGRLTVEGDVSGDTLARIVLQRHH